MPGRIAQPGHPPATAIPAAPPTSERIAWETAVNNPMRKMGFNFGLVYVFLRFSMLHESLTILAHVNLYLALITGLPAVGLALLGGAVQRTAQSRAGQFWIAFFICFVIAVPFSTWRGESLTVLSSYLKADYPILFILGGMVLTWKECKMVLASLAISGVCTLGMERIFSNMEDNGRISLSGGGTIANSNDYAAHLLLLMPFMLWVILAPLGRLYKIIFLPLLGAALFVDLQTGSRGAVIGMAAGCVLVLVKGPGKLRWILGLSAPLAVVAALSFLPASVMLRFSGILGDAQVTRATQDEAKSAAESSKARRYLLTRSLEFTMEHPVFGIGAGTFSAFEGGTSKLEGKHGQWQETHNAYTQISSENGVPAIFCYIAGIISGLILLNRTMLKGRRDKVPILVASAFCCMLAIAMTGTCMLFLSLGYRFYMPALTGLAIALERVSRMDPPGKASAPVASPSIARLPTQRLPQRPLVRENYYSGK
jgi:hypothetical protein